MNNDYPAIPDTAMFDDVRYDNFYNQPLVIAPQIDYNRQWALQLALNHLGKEVPFKDIFDLADEIYGYVVK